MISKNIYFQLLVIVTFFCNVIYAQTKPIEHIVSKGDNVYRLSLQYKVTMESIFKLNPDSRTLIKVGETLLIPNNSKSQPVSYNSEATKHLVSKGETKYGLSKKYNISIDQLEKANPSIVRMLIAGQTIDIPSQNQNPNNRVSDNSSGANKFHTVTKGETLWGISQKYNMSLETLKTLNKNNIIAYPTISIGQILTLSELTKNLEKEEDEDEDDEEEVLVNSNETYMVSKGDTKYSLSKRFNLSIDELEELNPEIVPILKTGTLIQTGKLKPNNNSLTTNEVATKGNNNDITKSPGNNIDKTNNVEPTFNSNLNLSVIWNDNLTFADSDLNDNKAKYYKGLILAIDSINKEYPQNKINIIKQEPSSKDSLDTSFNKTFIHPFDYSVTSSNSTKSIDLLSITTNTQDSLKKIFLKGLPSNEDMRNRVLEYLKLQNGHVICLYDNENSKSKDDIGSYLPNAEFIKINRKGSFQSKDLMEALSTSKKNFVIVESSEVGVFLNSTNILLKKMSTSDIQLVVLNSNKIPSKEKITTTRFKILRLLYPGQYNLEINKGMDSIVAISFAINYDAYKRLYKNDRLEVFNDNMRTKVLGFTFSYQWNNNVLENKAVPLFIFDENSEHTLISNDY